MATPGPLGSGGDAESIDQVADDRLGRAELAGLEERLADDPMRQDGDGPHLLGVSRYYLHPGYKEGVGGIVHPALGSLVSSELGRSESPMPNFVAVGRGNYGAGYAWLRPYGEKLPAEYAKWAQKNGESK